MKKSALLSVTDKTGIVDLGRNLVARGYELIATGGTASALRGGGLSVVEPGDELLGGRVKTLNPRIFAGILSRRTEPDNADLEKIDAPLIDFVVCNLYAEEIDIGGVALIRAAAKNHEHVAVAVDPADYGDLISADEAKRRALAAKAWHYVAAYDAKIAQTFSDDRLYITLARHQELRYGENPHQRATWWKCAGPGLHDARVIQGKELSYNNILDVSAAAALVSDLGADSVAIIKHQNPCGAALSPGALARAIACDSEAAFGGIVAVNGRFDEEMVLHLGTLFIEVIVARAFSEEALALLAKKKNLRLIEWPEPFFDPLEYKSIPGGGLSQTRDAFESHSFTVVSSQKPSDEQMRDLRIAEIVAKHVRSNAIVLVKDGATVGIGAGQMNRADSVRLAVMKAGEKTRGAVMASDAFFPFSDGLEAAYGVAAVVEPGGSIRDQEVIAAADRLKIALCFTGTRHFRH